MREPAWLVTAYHASMIVTVCAVWIVAIAFLLKKKNRNGD